MENTPISKKASTLMGINPIYRFKGHFSWWYILIISKLERGMTLAEAVGLGTLFNKLFYNKLLTGFIGW